jgi:HSP20 family molecular chaperone IbpA
MLSISDSLKTLWRKGRKEIVLFPKIDFLNSMDSYQLKIQLPEAVKDNLKIDIQSAYAVVEVNGLSKKIHFREPVDKTAVKTWYDNGIYSVKIPKTEMSPEERINRWAMVLGV